MEVAMEVALSVGAGLEGVAREGVAPVVVGLAAAGSAALAWVATVAAVEAFVAKYQELPAALRVAAAWVGAASEVVLVVAGVKVAGAQAVAATVAAAVEDLGKGVVTAALEGVLEVEARVLRHALLSR